VDVVAGSVVVVVGSVDDVVLDELVVEDELVLLVEDELEVLDVLDEPGWRRSAGGAGKSSGSRPSNAALMNRCQISAGKPPPVTERPCTSSIGRPPSGKPIHTTAV